MLEIVGILGKKDYPTDGVFDYAERLSGALEGLGFTSRLHVCASPRLVRAALTDVKASSHADDGLVAIMHATHLAWSMRGFPFRGVRIARAVQRASVPLIVILHDPSPFPGQGVIAALRRNAQVWTMKRLTRVSRATIFTVEPELVSWVGSLRSAERRKIRHVPVGSNLPSVESREHPSAKFEVGVFGVTGGSESEMTFILNVMKSLVREIPGSMLRVFGRGVPPDDPLKAPANLEVVREGVLPAVDVAERLASCDAALFVRGASTRRGSLVAEICAGLPVVASECPETGDTVRGTGTLLVPMGDVEAASLALIRICRDAELARELRERNQLACAQIFSWDVIAARFAEVLH